MQIFLFLILLFRRLHTGNQTLILLGGRRCTSQLQSRLLGKLDILTIYQKHKVGVSFLCLGYQYQCLLLLCSLSVIISYITWPTSLLPLCSRSTPKVLWRRGVGLFPIIVCKIPDKIHTNMAKKSFKIFYSSETGIKRTLFV